MTLRDELEGLAKELEDWSMDTSPGAGLPVDGIAERMRVLAARFPEAEKPAEPAHASAPLPRAVASVVSQLRDLSENVARGYYPHQPELGDTIAALADRIAESVPGGAEEVDALALIAAERRRQIEREGWTPEHDDEHRHGELAKAAAAYAIQGTDAHVTDPSWGEDEDFPWPGESDKRRKHTSERCLVIAGALIVAEIERRRRQEKRFWQDKGVQPAPAPAPPEQKPSALSGAAASGGAWTCYHCGETFSGAEAAEHFGRREDADPPTCISTRHPLVVRLRARIRELEERELPYCKACGLADAEPCQETVDGAHVPAAPPAPAPSAALTPEEEERIKRNPVEVLAEILAGSDVVPLLTLTPQQWREATANLYGRPAQGASPRRCLACNLLNPGSDVCPASNSGKHISPLTEDETAVLDASAFNACPDVAELEEALREMVREEMAKLGRGGDEPSLFTPEDWRNLYAGLAMSSLITKYGDEWPGDTQLAMRCWSFADLLSEPLRAGFSAPRPEPPEEHVAPDTSSTRRKP